MADGGHFGFLPTTNFPHFFQRDTSSNFLLKPSKKTKQLRKEPSLSTVTEVHQMTQLHCLQEEFCYEKQCDCYQE